MINKKPHNIFITSFPLLFLFLILGVLFVFFLQAGVVLASQSCLLCDGELGKERCLNGECRSSCFPVGIKCETSEGHCANGSCDSSCCEGKALQPGQSCLEDTLIGGTDNPNTTTICLDPGHGGSLDPGGHAVPDIGEYEADWTLRVANDLEDQLLAKGYRVIRTRTRTGLASSGVNLGPADDNAATRTRTQFCYNNNADFMYRLHFDAGDQPQRTWQIIPNPKMNKIYELSRKYGEALQSNLISYLGPLVIEGGSPEKTNSLPVIDGGVKAEGTTEYPTNFQGTLEAQVLGGPPVVLSELMTLSPESITWLKNSSNYQKLIEGLAYAFSKSIDLTNGSIGAGNKAVAIAKTQLGKPYVFATPTCTRDKWPDAPPPKGCPYFDCSKFTDWAWYWASNKKIYLYAYTISDWNFATKNPKLYKTFRVTNTKNIETINKELKPGDLLYMGPSGSDSHHVVMFVGNNTYIHAPFAGAVVSYGRLSTYPDWSGDVVRPTP